MAGMAHPWATARGGRERRLARAHCHRRAAAHKMRAAWAPAGERRLFCKKGDYLDGEVRQGASESPWLEQ